MNDDHRNDIAADLRDFLEPDGSNAGEVIHDLAVEYGVPESEVEDVYNEMVKL